jgi:hypothetical protein
MKTPSISTTAANDFIAAVEEAELEKATAAPLRRLILEQESVHYA